MKVGASQYHPGLTVRWNDIGDDWASLFAPRVSSLLCIERRKGDGWAIISFVRYTDFRTFARRCDAKRAAEVLVGQWWREKCGREAMRKALRKAMRKRYMVAMKDNGECLLDRMAKAACAAWADVSALEGADLDRLAEVYGVEARSGE